MVPAASGWLKRAMRAAGFAQVMADLAGESWQARRAAAQALVTSRLASPRLAPSTQFDGLFGQDVVGSGLGYGAVDDSLAGGALADLAGERRGQVVVRLVLHLGHLGADVRAGKDA